MVNFAFILPLLASFSAFATPVDLQQETDSVAPLDPALPTVLVPEIQENGAAQPSSETTDVTDAPLSRLQTLDGLPLSLILSKLDPRSMLKLANINKDFRLKMLQEAKELVATFKANKELSFLRQFQFSDNVDRLAHLLESELVEKYGADPTKIRPVIQRAMGTLALGTLARDLSTLLPNGSEGQVFGDINTVMCRWEIEIMFTTQDRTNDEDLDVWLSRNFQELGYEIDAETIRDVRAQVGYSLAECDKKLVAYMEENFKMEPAVTQNVINKSRQNILGDSVGIGHIMLASLFVYRDSDVMDTQINNLVAEKEIENAEAIKDAIPRARNQIKLEKENLVAKELAAYNDDLKMSELLAKSANNPTVDFKEIVKEARWRNTIDLAICFCKLWALCKLIPAGASYHKYQTDEVESLEVLRRAKWFENETVASLGETSRAA